MKKLFLFLSTCCATSILAQNICSVAKINSSNHVQVVSTAHVALMNKYDAKFQHLNINIERTNKNISGNIRSLAQVKTASLDTFALELYSTMIIDSARINGVLLNPIRVVDEVSFILPSPLLQNTMIDALIYYHGTPPTINGSAAGDGLNNGTSQSWGNQVTWSLSEPYAAYEWFPCKQQLQDKLDSCYLFVTTDSSNKVGSNGVLTNVVTLGNKKRYEWKERHAIDYYLISVAVAKYIDYRFYAHPIGTTDSVLIQNYIYDNPATLAFFKTSIDQTKGLLELFSTKFGLYPFWNEKYGHCMAPFGGGMEHQTMTSLGSFNLTLVAHELGHQWFGDNVTCSSWNDIFINEGFASYSEYIALEQFNPTNAAPSMQQVHTSVMSAPDGSIYNPDTTNMWRIFDSRLSYDKGSAILHSLRFVINNDNLFFTVLQNFQTQFKNSTASIANFKSIAETTTGLNLTQFFNQWIYGEGYPTFDVRWNQVGTTFYLKNTETVSMSMITPLFITPLEYKLSRNSGDTIIKVNHNSTIENYTFTIPGTITAVTTDPNNWIVNQGTVIQDASLVGISENESIANQITIYPNPALDALFVTTPISINEKWNYFIMDVTGKLILEGNLVDKIEISNLKSGLYFIQLKSKESNRSKTSKFVKN